MGRRRKGGLGENIGPLTGLILLLLFLITNGNPKAFSSLIHMVLIWFFALGILVIVVSIIFRLVRHLGRPKQQNYELRVNGGGIQAYCPTPTSSLIDKIRATDWYQFEKVIGLIYQLQGFKIHRRGGSNPDGGIDLIIKKNEGQTAVQCKRWKKWKVDVPKVRELIGAMTHEGIQSGVIVALNGFTKEAEQLAVQHNIDIIQDDTLEGMIGELPPEYQHRILELLDDETKYCPKCEAVMILRVPHQGQQWRPFWGCSRYPRCHGRLKEV